jgi:hypothetical protein
MQAVEKGRVRLNLAPQFHAARLRPEPEWPELLLLEALLPELAVLDPLLLDALLLDALVCESLELLRLECSSSVGCTSLLKLLSAPSAVFSW